MLSIQHITTTLLLTWNAISSISACNIMSVTECSNFKYVSEFNLNAFVPAEKWKEHCSLSKSAWDCVFQPKYMDGCTLEETFFYDMGKGVADIVCNDPDYKEHSCLGSKTLDDKVSENCITPLSFASDVDCEYLESTRACVSTKVQSLCGTDDSHFVDKLSYAFLQPYANILDSCELTTPEEHEHKASGEATDSNRSPDVTTASSEISATNTTTTEHTPNGQPALLSSLLSTFALVLTSLALVL